MRFGGSVCPRESARRSVKLIFCLPSLPPNRYLATDYNLKLGKLDEARLHLQTGLSANSSRFARSPSYPPARSVD